MLAKIRKEFGVGAVGENFQGVENARAGTIEIRIATDADRIKVCRVYTSAIKEFDQK